MPASVRPPASLSGAPVNHGGLVVQAANGLERMVMTDQEICDDVLATIPKLKAAVAKDTFGRRWRQCKRKNGVDMYELIPGGNDDPEDDLDLAHAMVAKAELRCHLNEVLNVLINPQSSDFEASMRSLCGNKFQRGQVLFQQRRKITLKLRNTTASVATHESSSDDVDATPQEGLIGVQLATLRPKLRVKISTKHKRTQRLVFASCTQQSASKDRAIHVLKTIPKSFHDQVVSSDDRTALRRELDHIAVGYDIQSKHGGYGAITHTTRIFLHSYASIVPPSQYDRQGSKTSVGFSSSELARRRDTIMNPEAQQVMDILTKSLRQFETVIRRRRLGFQSFTYFPTIYNDSNIHSCCSICSKNFSFFRRDFFCQLCGNMVCNDCSQMYEVEARVGEVRKNRCCIQCIVRVDNCVFDDEDLLAALGPVVVDADESSWLESSASDDDDTVSVASSTGSLQEISDSLFSTDALQRSQALGMLAQLIGKQSTSSPPTVVRATSGGRIAPPPPAPTVKDTKKQILRDLETHLAESLQSSRANIRSAEDCIVYGEEHDYVFNYDNTGAQTTNSNHPLAPMPESHKEAKRLQYIEQSGVLDEKYDRAALDLLAQVAAKKLNCPIGFVSVVDDAQFRAIGTYNLPEVAHALPRNENMCMHGVYAEKPMIIKNPQRDMRFAQMPCVQDLGVKFYAGFPLYAPDGSVLGSLCAADAVPHNNISTKDYATMEALSKLASDLLLPRSPTTTRASKPSFRSSHRSEPLVVS